MPISEYPDVYKRQGWGNASGLKEASAWGVERVTDKGYFADTSIRVTKTQKNSFAAVIPVSYTHLMFGDL